MDRYDNCATISLTACALSGHNNTFLDYFKSEGLISLICALNSPPAPTAALFLVLSSLPSHAVSWKRRAAHSQLWCRRAGAGEAVYPPENEREQQGNKRPDTPTLLHANNFNQSTKHAQYWLVHALLHDMTALTQSQEEEVSLIYYSMAPSGWLQSEPLSRRLCSIYYCAFTGKRGHSVSPDALRVKKPFRIQKGRKAQAS